MNAIEKKQVLQRVKFSLETLRSLAIQYSARDNPLGIAEAEAVYAKVKQGLNLAFNELQSQAQAITVTDADRLAFAAQVEASVD